MIASAWGGCGGRILVPGDNIIGDWGAAHLSDILARVVCNIFKGRVGESYANGCWGGYSEVDIWRLKVISRRPTGSFWCRRRRVEVICEFG